MLTPRRELTGAARPPEGKMSMRAFLLPAVVTLATFTAGLQVQAAPANVGVSFVETFQRGEAYTPVTAVGLKPTASPQAAAATDVLVLVDTSASQAGAFRTSATEALRGLLARSAATPAAVIDRYNALLSPKR